MDLNELKQIIKEMLTNKSVLLVKPEIINEANYERVKDKIENQMVPVVMISAFRGGSPRKENFSRQQELEGIVSKAKFPWTKMPGSGYVEEPEVEEPEVEEVPEEDAIEAETHPGNPLELEEHEDVEQIEPEGVEVKENSILIWDETRPDMGTREKKDLKLFDLAKLLATKYNQDTFVYGKRVMDDEGSVEMNIRLYDKEGKPVKADWAGPWSTVTEVGADDLFWSTIGSKRARLTEMLDQYKGMKVKSKLDAMKKQYKLDAIKSAMNKLE